MRRPHFEKLGIWAIAIALGAGLAAPEARAERKVKVAILDVRAVGGCDAKTAAGLSALVAYEASQFDVQIVSGADLQALISFDRERQLLGCSDTTCLAEIGGALGVDFILSSEVSEVGGVWLVSMTMLDVARSQAKERVVKRVGREKQLVDATTEATREVFQKMREHIAARAAAASRAAQAEPAVATGAAATEASAAPAGGVEAAPATAPAKEDRRARRERLRKEKELAEQLKAGEKPAYERRSKGLMIAGIVMIPVGVLAVLGGGAIYGQGGTGNQKTGTVVACVGVLAAVAGIPMAIVGGSKRRVVERPEASLLMTPAPEGLSIGIVPAGAGFSLAF